MIALIKLRCPITRRALHDIPLCELAYQLNISDKYRYVYVDNPKTGCSTLKSMLVELETRGSGLSVDYMDWRIFHSDKSPLKAYNPFSLARTLTTLKKSGYFFFTFVRNPYTRLLSCYINKFKDPNYEFTERFYKNFGFLPQSFDEFISFISKQSIYDMNPHWRPQYAHIHVESINYDFIGRFENYSKAYVSLFESLNIPSDQIPEFRHLNKSAKSESLHAIYNESNVKLVRDIYKKDFEYFNYPIDLP
jgi:hypothetical protein